MVQLMCGLYFRLSLLSMYPTNNGQGLLLHLYIMLIMLLYKVQKSNLQQTFNIRCHCLASTNRIVHPMFVMFLAYSDGQMTGHMTLFLHKQLNTVRCSINRDCCTLALSFIFLFSSYISCISALTLSPSMGAKICCIYGIINCDCSYVVSQFYLLSLYMGLGVGLKSKQRQRKDADGLSCKLHY